MDVTDLDESLSGSDTTEDDDEDDDVSRIGNRGLFLVQVLSIKALTSAMEVSIEREAVRITMCENQLLVVEVRDINVERKRR